MVVQPYLTSGVHIKQRKVSIESQRSIQVQVRTPRHLAADPFLADCSPCSPITASPVMPTDAAVPP